MQTYCTGPCRLYIQFPGTSVPFPWGTCERGARIRDIYESESLINDFGGTKLAFEESHQGHESLVAGMLTRYRELVLSLLAGTPRFITPAVDFATLVAPVGGDAMGDIGTHIALEGKNLTLFVEYMYASPGGFLKPVMTAGGLPAGRRYFNAQWKGGETSTGTAPKTTSFLLHCKRLFIPATGGMATWDSNLAAIVGIPWEQTP